MSLSKRLLFSMLALALGSVFGCGDDNTAQPPKPPPQIDVAATWVKSGDPKNPGLQSNDVFDVMFDSSGKLWFATQAGVSRFSGTTTELQYNQNNGLPNPKVRAIAEYNGKLWVATWGGGIGVFDMVATTWSTLTGLTSGQVSSIAVDEPNNKLYFGTNEGVNIYEDNDAIPMNQRWTRFGTSNGLLDPLVSTIEVVQRGGGTEYWYGPRVEYILQEGQERFHGITVQRTAGSPVHYTVVNSALPEPNVNDFLYDATNDVFWIAFGSKGLAKVDVNSSTWEFFDQRNGLPSEQVYSIVMIGSNLWVGTQNGVARQVSEGAFRGYGHSGGLPSDRVRKLYVDPNNSDRLYLGMIDGGGALVIPSTAE